MKNERAEFIRGLRTLADFYESRPHLEVSAQFHQPINIWPTVEETPEMVRIFKAGGAKPIKMDQYFVLRLTFGPLSLDANWKYQHVDCTAEDFYNKSLDTVPVEE